MTSKPSLTGKRQDATKLPEPRLDSDTSVESALQGRRSVREFDNRPLSLAEISQILWAAQGITATEGRRTTPSAGALYPLEVFVVAGREGELAPGLYQYRPHGHQLVLLEPGDKRAKLAEAALGQTWMADAPVMVVLAALSERSSMKYRERAERYVQMEVGHAAQNVHLQAVALGLGTTVVGAFEEDAVKLILALSGNLQPLCLMPIGKARL